MIKSVEVTGKNEDEAIASALDEIGLSRDEVSVEILERAKSGFLGLKSTPAVVRITYEVADEAIITGGRSISVEGFLTGLFERMEIDIKMDIKEDDGAMNVTLYGQDPGAIIGRRGETLDAIQRLTNNVVNRGTTGRMRVNIDAENYRQRRNETLENLAERTAGKVMKYRRNMTLEPMNAYERHIIHTALQSYDYISTHSIGTEPNRRIVVSYGRKSSEASREDGRGNQQRRSPQSQPTQLRSQQAQDAQQHYQAQNASQQDIHQNEFNDSQQDTQYNQEHQTAQQQGQSSQQQQEQQTPTADKKYREWS